MSELLAKSPPAQGPALSLLQHSCDTDAAAQALFQLTRRWGRSFCRFFAIDDPAERERFLLNLRVACVFHDLGKANEDFQRAVTQPGFLPQTLRHEHISALVLCLEPVRAWLAGNPALDVDAITAAVLSHHLKASESDDRYEWCQPRGKAALALFLDHADVAAMFERVRSIAGLPPPPPLPTGKRWREAPPWEPARQQGRRHARKLRRALRRDRPRRSFVLALKAGVIVADSAASGLVRTGHSIIDWIHDAAHKDPLTADKLHGDVIAPRCEQISRHIGAPFHFHPFQERAAELGSRALLLAGCGSGKTLAAWRWAHAQLRRHELGHVLFLYPTRGTATEGFRDYVGWAPEADATLLHATSAYELAGMHKNPGDSLRGKRIEPDEAQMRLFSLGLWPRRYFSATVDQFLAFLEHRYESLCLLPLLADSAVILDEVHSYDASMFDNLIAFLEHFRVPVLCMTATLPPARRAQLEDQGLQVYPSPDDSAHLQDLHALETHPRYRIHTVADAGAAFERALAGHAAGKRVLWVVNTVARCQRWAHQLAATLGAPALAYHSRYRLADRQQKHRATVDAFKQRGQPAIAVTTQVCEMSLDLDADVLITEHAPISSLVQRLGRANRHATPGSDRRADIYIYAPESARPYTRDDLAATRALLDELGIHLGPVETSQRTLAEALIRHSPAEPTAGGSARFIDSGYYAIPGSFRDEDAFSATCVLDSDLAALAPHRDHKPALRRHLPGYELSVPQRHVLPDRPPEWLPRYIALAPADRYDPELGFLTGDQT